MPKGPDHDSARLRLEREAQDLLVRALDCEEEDREGFVTHEAAGQPELRERVIELYEKEHQAELKRARAMQRAAEAGAALEQDGPSEQELKEMEELKQLEKEGFSDWTRGEFTKFTKACERLGAVSPSHERIWPMLRW